MYNPIPVNRVHTKNVPDPRFQLKFCPNFVRGLVWAKKIGSPKYDPALLAEADFHYHLCDIWELWWNIDIYCTNLCIILFHLGFVLSQKKGVPCLLTIFVISSITVMEHALLNIWVTLHLVLVCAIARNHVLSSCCFSCPVRWDIENFRRCVIELHVPMFIMDKAMKIWMFLAVGLQVSYLSKFILIFYLCLLN